MRGSLSWGAMEDHPFKVAWRTRKLDAWIDALSPEVVLRSPVLSKPFHGRPAAKELYGVLFEAFDEFEITDELADGGAHAFFWRGSIGGRRIEGADLIRHDEHGEIAEIGVLIRPLADIAVFASAIGPPLVGGRSSARGALTWLLTFPLKGLLRVADAIACRLIGL